MTSKSVRFIFFDYSVLRYNLSSSRKIDSRCEWALVNGDSIVGKYALRANAVRAYHANRNRATLEIVELLPLGQG
jgi:hypothetical protein